MLQAIDRLVQAWAAEGGDEEAARARRVLGIILINAFGASWTAVVQGLWGSWHMSVLAVGLLLASPVALGVLRLTASVTGAAHVICGSAFSVFAIVSLATGGTAVAHLFFGAIPALYAVLVISLRGALLWGGLWAGVLALLAGLEAAGTAFPYELERDPMRDDHIRAAFLFLVLALAATSIGEHIRRATRSSAAVSDARYGRLVRSAPLGILSIDAEGRVLEANAAMASLCGAPDASVFVGLDMLNTPAFRSVDVAQNLRERLESGETLTRDASWTTLWGKEVSLRVHIAPIPAPEGETGGYLVLCEDVAEQKRAAAALRESEERRRFVLSNSTDLISAVDEDGSIAFISDNVKRLLGYDAEEAVGAGSEPHVHPEDLERCSAAFRRTLAGETVTVEPFRFQRADGEWRWLESTARPIRKADGRMQIVSATRDVTDRLELERRLRQSQKMEALGLLAGGVAHDFNNLLTVFTAYAEDLADHDDADVRASANDMAAAAERGSALTRRLLTFSRAATHEPRIVDLTDAVASLEAMLGRLLPEDIDLAFDLAGDLPPVRVDPGMIEEAVVNLVLNARAAMPSGGSLVVRTLEVSERDGADGREPEPRQAAIEVSDSGAGMTADVLMRAFEPFFSTKPAGEGSGLGLAMVYGICEQLGGRAEIESAPNAGTTVRLRFPAAEEAGEAPDVERPQGPWVEGCETVLVAEDDPLVRSVIVSSLESSGYRVLVAKDGLDALSQAQARADELDLVLTDVVMPGLSGPEMVAELRAKHPEMRALFVSGYPRGRGGIPFSLEDDQILRKPFTTRDLLGRVRQTLDAQL